MNTEKSSWCPPKVFTPLTNYNVTGRNPAYYQKRKKNAKPNTKALIYKSGLPERYAGVIVAQSLREEPTNIGFDSRPNL